METGIGKASVSRNLTWPHRSLLRSVHLPSASTCGVWLLSQGGAGGREGGCSCPSQGHSQKQDVFLSEEIKVRCKEAHVWREDRSGCYFSSLSCPEIAQICSSHRFSAPAQLRWPEGTLALALQTGEVPMGRTFLSTRGPWPLCWDGCVTGQPQS